MFMALRLATRDADNHLVQAPIPEAIPFKPHAPAPAHTITLAIQAACSVYPTPLPGACTTRKAILYAAEIPVSIIYSLWIQHHSKVLLKMSLPSQADSYSHQNCHHSRKWGSISIQILRCCRPQPRSITQPLLQLVVSVKISRFLLYSLSCQLIAGALAYSHPSLHTTHIK